MQYFHVDVFSSQPLSGNGLTVVFPDKELSDQSLLEITREFKQFETIFIYPKTADDSFPVRIFTVDEELGFAGHPVLGAGAVIHQLFYSNHSIAEITINLSGRKVIIKSELSGKVYDITMNQGQPEFMSRITPFEFKTISGALNLEESDLYPDYPLEVISTGLPYLLVPVKNALPKAKITHPDFESLLAGYGAKFVYVFDPETIECRTWDNRGDVEDIATGSAAGPLCAYLVKNGFKQKDNLISISQGRFVNRPSIIYGWVSQTNNEVFIRGRVSFFGIGELFI